MEPVKAALIKAAQQYSVNFNDIAVTRPEPQFGDFSTNISMKLAPILGKNPREIAKQIAENLRQNELFTDVSIADPGFINLCVADSYYQQNISDVLAQGEKFGKNQTNADKKILVEYSDPNPFKPLHAGHLYTTLVGDAIALLLESTGANVTRLNYGGDVGLHVGKSMWAIIRKIGGEYPERLNDVAPDDRAVWLGECYVEGSNAYETDESSKQEIISTNKKVYALHENQDKTSAFAQIYWTCRQWSYDYFPVFYKKLEVVEFDRNIPESEVTPLGLQTVRDQLKNGVYSESQGAIIFNGEPYGLHTRVFINSAGLPTYETKDVGLLLTKWNDYKFDKSIVITANEQAEYMKVMLASVAQFAPEPASKSKHLTHGTVKLSGGVKFSSRKGNGVGALDVLDSATKANIEQTGSDNQSAMLAAVKYSFLKQKIGGDIIYDPIESVSVMGNSGPYLQYAYVRALSILRKCPEFEPTYDFEFRSDERLVARKLDEYSEVIAEAAKKMQPHLLCTYLYELAQEFSRFYEHNKVVGDVREQQRLTLISAYAGILGNGLRLLGIDRPERM